MLSLIMQLLGIVSALDFLQPVPAADAVQRLAGPAARPDRLGPGGPRRLGQRAVRRPRPRVGLYALFEKRRRRRLSSGLTSLTMSFMEASSAVRARSVPTIMGQVLFLVGAALGLCAFATFLGRDIDFATARICSFAGFGMLIAQSFVRPLRTGPLGIGWLAAIAALIGFGLAPDDRATTWRSIRAR